MELVFELSGDQLPASGQLVCKTFGEAGGVIGRADDCDWIILDSHHHVSSQHAKITFSDGEFYLTDLSTNGTQVLQSGQRLRKGETHLVEHGTQYRIGAFEIRARLIEEPAGFGGTLNHPAYAGRLIPEDVFLGFDLLDGLDRQADADAGLNDLLPGYVAQQASQQGVGYGSADVQNLLVPELVAPVPHPTPVEAVIPQPQSEDFWQRFANALGVDFSTFDLAQREAFAVSAAGLLKHGISGLQQTLRTRSELKNELRLALSMAQHTGNNPLKYAGDASEAISLLVNAQRSGQLSAEHAVARAYRDIQAHQVAMLAASRAALRSVLEHFAPHQLTLRLERDTPRPLFFGNAARWRAYERYHHAIGQDDDWSERLLARDFAQAYEEQVRLLATLHIEH